MISPTGGSGLLTVPFEYDVADLLALTRHPGRWWGPLFYLGYLLLGGSFLIWLMIDGGFSWLFFAALIFVAAISIGPWTWRPVLRYRRMRREKLIGPFEFAIQPDHLLVTSKQGELRLRWSAVVKLRQSANRFFIFPERSVAFVVPRRAFASDDAFQAFIQAARERWQSRD